MQSLGATEATRTAGLYSYLRNLYRNGNVSGYVEAKILICAHHVRWETVLGEPGVDLHLVHCRDRCRELGH